MTECSYLLTAARQPFMKAVVEEFVTKSANLFIAMHRLVSVQQSAAQEYTYMHYFLSQLAAKALLYTWGPLTHAQNSGA